MFTAKRAACACALAVTATCTVARGDEAVLLPVCSSDAIADVHRTASPTVVDVRAPGLHGIARAGLGFVFGTRRYVATALTLVENGRGIVVLVDGEAHDASVVAVSHTRDVAIVKLERPAAVAPLVSARTAVPVGEPVLTFAKSDESHEADTVIDTGIITAAKAERLRTNAELTVGAPVLDCAGEVVGIATKDGVAVAATLDDLLSTVDPVATPYASGWSLMHPLVTFHGQIGAGPQRQGWLGFGLGTALIGDDRWYFPFEARALWLVEPRAPNPLTEQRGLRLQLASAAGYRFLLAGGDTPFYLIPTVGAVLSYDHIVTTSAELLVAPGCTPPNRCPVGIRPIEFEDERLRVMPTVGLKLQFGFGTVGYELAIDVTSPSASVHQLSTGFQF